MKTNSKIKKTIASLLTIALFFSLFTILGEKQEISANATYPLKVHYLDVAGDATLIKYRDNSGTVHYGMIDAGQETKNNKASESAAAYFAGIADREKKPRTLDFVVITHAHNDHYVGLKYFDDYKIHVNTMYVNSFYNNLEADGKISLADRLSSMKRNGLVDNILYLSNNKATNIVYSGGFSLSILGSALPFDASKSSEGTVNSRSMMCVLDYDNYKYIFMGDVYNKGLTKVAKGNPTYTATLADTKNIRSNVTYKTVSVPISDFFIPTSDSTKVIYKIGHHGRRNANNYDAASEDAMYNFISKSTKYRDGQSKNKNKIYCIANKYYSTNGKYSNSTPLQKQWFEHSAVRNVYYNTGHKYKTSTSRTSVSTEKVKGITALTSTTSLGFN